MRSKAAGAPLRAFGTLVAIWVLARLVSWNIPANIAIDPVSPFDGKTELREISQIRNDETLCLREWDFSMSFDPRFIADKKHDIMISSNRMRYSHASDPVDGTGTRSLHSLSILPAKVDGGGIPAGEPSKRIRSRPLELEPNWLPLKNLAANHRSDGLNGYFWIFTRQTFRAMRSGTRSGGTIISNGQYGGSQIGAILSYPILTKPGRELAIYGRLTAALAPLGQEEFAVGARIHPVRKLPFSLHAEQRFNANSGGDRGTAFYLAGGTGPDQIVAHTVLETYAQAGYIVGKNATYFFDGSATLQRPVAESNRKKLSVGAGVWAGGQRNVTRLDVGPRADISVPIGTGFARIAVDWRVRIAGDARPGNGLAITVSTGF